MDNGQAIGQRIRETRKSLNLRQADLAERTDISISHLSDIERGALMPTIPTLRRISQALDRPLEYFLQEGAAPHALSLVMTRTLLGQAAVTRLIEQVREQSDGELTIQLYQHAWAFEEAKGLADGSIHLFLDDLLSFEPFSQLCGVVSQQFFFRDRAQYDRFMSSSLFQEQIYQKLLEKGIRLLNPTSSWVYGSFELLFATQPIFTPADLAGRKFRSYNSKAANALRQTLDTIPVQTPWNSGPEAFRENKIEAFLAPVGYAPPLKLHEVTRYITLLDYGYTLNLLVSINDYEYRRLSPKAQQALHQAIETAGPVFSQLAQASIDTYMRQLSHDFGLPLIQPSPEPWRARFSAALRQVAGELLDEEIYETLQRL